MRTLFDLYRTAQRLDVVEPGVTKLNPSPFLACLECGEYIEVQSYRLHIEFDKIPDVVCHLCHSDNLAWISKAPTPQKQFELREKRMHTLAVEVQRLKALTGLQTSKPIETVQPEHKEALGAFDALLAKPVQAKAEGIPLAK